MTASLKKPSILFTMATANIEFDYVFENDKRKFKCRHEVCKNRSFATAYTIKRHYETVHAKQFECPIDDCNEVFPTRLALSKHKKKHKKNFPCDWCPSSFTSEKYLKAHKTKYHEHIEVSRNFCIQCEKQFDNYGELQNHINDAHNKKSKFELVNSAYKLKHQDWRMNLGKFFLKNGFCFYSHTL